MTGVLTKRPRVNAEFSAERFETKKHQGARAPAFARDLHGIEPLHAVEPEYGVERGFARRLLGIERFDQGEGLVCGALSYCLFRLGIESSEQFAGRNARPQSTCVAELDMRGEIKKTGANIGQEFLSGRIEMPGSRRQKNESLAKTRSELGENKQELFALALQGQNYGNGVRGPGADLARAGEVQIGCLALKPESLAQDTPKP